MNYYRLHEDDRQKAIDRLYSAMRVAAVENDISLIQLQVKWAINYLRLPQDMPRT